MAMRSDRDTDPVLICPTPVATAKSAIKVSSVSPGTVGNNGAIAVAPGQADGVQGLGDGADLVEFNQEGVSRTHFDATL